MAVKHGLDLLLSADATERGANCRLLKVERAEVASARTNHGHNPGVLGPVLLCIVREPSQFRRGIA